MYDQLKFAYGAPPAFGTIKNSPADFCVEEHLGFDLAGVGEHLFILVEKELLNTEEMVKIIAKSLNLPSKSISYAGLKDKFATTKQWFSIHLPGIADPDLSSLNTEHYRILKTTRHNKKLKVGALKENHFIIKIHNFNFEKEKLYSTIEKIKTFGVPNYFGPQRFGHDGRNLEKAKEVLLQNKKIKDRHLRGIYYSAARSFLFNQIVSARVEAGNWNLPLPGDLMMLSGSHSVFPITAVDEEIKRRVSNGDISPAAPLWGKGKELITEEALEYQNQALAPWEEWCIALESHGLQKLYRAMVLTPHDLKLNNDVFSFTLPAGAYATTVLREILQST